MKFFKENSHIISRLIITHVAMSIFGLVLFFFTNLKEPPTLMLYASLFSVAFFYVISYTTMWEFGAKDKPSYDAGRRTNPAKRAIAVAFFGELFWIVLAIAYLCISQFNVNVASMFYVAEFLTSSCYTGTEVFLKNNVLASGSSLTPFVVAGVYLLGSAILIVVDTFGFVFGTKELRIIPQKKTAKK